ncbi:MAG: hypothetical protein EXR75_00475 [Myxococcales bacterium]|nr:hypothetical protein [Myxococcales bacterium]
MALPRLAFQTLAAALLAAGILGCGTDTTTGFETHTSAGGAGGGSAGQGASSGTNGTNANGTGTGGAGASNPSSGSGFDGVIGGDRPVTVHVPPGYDPAEPAPLLILLHGYTASGKVQEIYLGFTEMADKHGFLYAYPDGTFDKRGQRFWNATDACCNFNGSDVDDSGYLRQVIDEIKQAYTVDAKRVYFFGHSNGGFMSHRMACEHADAIAAFGSLAGATYKDETQCKPSEPVTALVVHGSLDPTILYGGGKLFGGEYPGALETSETWAMLNGCSLTADETPADKDLTVIVGSETKVTRWDIGCEGASLVEQWKLVGSQHLPGFKGEFKAALFDFFLAHPKP